LQVGIVDFSDKVGLRVTILNSRWLHLLLSQAKWLYASRSVKELLGYEPEELVGKPSIDLTHPDESAAVQRLHLWVSTSTLRAVGVNAAINSDTITQDKAAVLAYLRLRHKDPLRGYVLCCVVRITAATLLCSLTGAARSVPHDRPYRHGRERIVCPARSTGYAQCVDGTGSANYITYCHQFPIPGEYIGLVSFTRFDLLLMA
jgi:hypothetical protein